MLMDTARRLTNQGMVSMWRHGCVVVVPAKAQQLGSMPGNILGPVPNARKLEGGGGGGHHHHHLCHHHLTSSKFIELLRKGSKKDRNAAIDFLRTVLTPSALDAYPV
ncbi:hypothetical protein Tco_0164153 [Tanacetum coccineum]